MSKRAIIIHGWEGNPYDAWKAWLKAKLKKKGFIVSAPNMPNPMNPDKQEWIDAIAKVVKNADDECYLVGHSLGCIAILRYLESLPENSMIGGCVLVAGFVDDVDIEPLKSFVEPPLDVEKVRSVCKRVVVISSDNDPLISMEQTKRMVHALSAQFVLEPLQGHLDEDDNVKELPSALKAVLEMAR